MIISKSCGKDYLTEMKLEGSDVHAVYADQPVEFGGGGMDMRPGQILLCGYAACMNITVRKMLNEQNLPFRNVTVSVDMDNSTKGLTKFYSKIEIDADIPQEKKDEIIAEVKNCPVCNILANEKQFLDME